MAEKEKEREINKMKDTQSKAKVGYRRGNSNMVQFNKKNQNVGFDLYNYVVILK